MENFLILLIYCFAEIMLCALMFGCLTCFVLSLRNPDVFVFSWRKDRYLFFFGTIFFFVINILFICSLIKL